MKKIALILLTLCLSFSCNIVHQIGAAYNMSQCEFSYNSIKNVQLMNIRFDDPSSLSITNIASVMGVLMGGNGTESIPLSMMINLNVKNPNPEEAKINGLEYQLAMNNILVTTGDVRSTLRVGAQETQQLSLQVGLDLQSLLQQNDREGVLQGVKSFLGLSKEEVKMSIKVWPTIMIGETPIKSPVALPIEFTYNGS